MRYMDVNDRICNRPMSVVHGWTAEGRFPSQCDSELNQVDVSLRYSITSVFYKYLFCICVSVSEFSLLQILAKQMRQYFIMLLRVLLET